MDAVRHAIFVRLMKVSAPMISCAIRWMKRPGLCVCFIIELACTSSVLRWYIVCICTGRNFWKHSSLLVKGHSVRCPFPNSLGHSRNFALGTFPRLRQSPSQSNLHCSKENKKLSPAPPRAPMHASSLFHEKSFRDEQPRLFLMNFPTHFWLALFLPPDNTRLDFHGQWATWRR